MANLDEQSRRELLSEARRLGIERPERMTRVELRDAIIRKTVPEEEQAAARGLFGVARSMLASVVESGLNMPDAAKVIRGDNSYGVPAENQSIVATVTLAEIYAAQGHRARALRVLEDVLLEEPDHEEARRVRDELYRNSASQRKSASEESTRPTAVSSDIPESTKLTSQAGELKASREALTVEAPPVLETTEYIPGGFVETTGEAIDTGEPPQVVAVKAAPAPVAPEFVAASVDESPRVEPIVADEETTTERENIPIHQEATERAQAVSEAPAGEVVAVEPSVEVELAVEKVQIAEKKEADNTQEPSAKPALVVAQSAGALRLYWELPQAAIHSCGLDHTEGRAALRVVSFEAAGSAPKRDERTIVVEDSMSVNTSEAGQLGAGVLNLSDLGEATAIRAAIGWETEDGFLPISVGRSVEQWGADRQARELVERAISAF